MIHSTTTRSQLVPALLFGGALAMGWLACGPQMAQEPGSEGGAGPATGGSGGKATGGSGGKDDEPETGGKTGTGGTQATGGKTGGTGGAPATGGAPGTGGTPGTGGAPATGKGLGPWTGHDNVAASPSVPGGLKPAQVPQLVSIGFDDNAYSGLEGSNGTGGFTWAVNFLRDKRNPAGRGQAATFDGTPARVSFYLTTIYGSQWQSESPAYVKKAWRMAADDQHELGNHTVHHNDGNSFGAETWTTELKDASEFMAKPFNAMEDRNTPDVNSGVGIGRATIVGFRAPFLHITDPLYPVLAQQGFRYDTSIEDGFQARMNGTNFNWPFTLDAGSEVQDMFVNEWKSEEKKPITKHAGMWELPVYPVIVPPDDLAATYGVPPGLRKKLHDKLSWFDAESAKITGFDYNLWVQFGLTKAEFLAILKYTFDLRLKGNRAPFLFGAHTDVYSSKYTAAMGATDQERREAIEEFFAYVLSKPEVRVVPYSAVLDWCRNPVSL